MELKLVQVLERFEEKKNILENVILKCQNELVKKSPDQYLLITESAFIYRNLSDIH